MKQIIVIFAILIVVFIVGYLFADEWIPFIMDSSTNADIENEPSLADKLFN